MKTDELIDQYLQSPDTASGSTTRFIASGGVFWIKCSPGYFPVLRKESDHDVVFDTRGLRAAVTDPMKKGLNKLKENLIAPGSIHLAFNPDNHAFDLRATRPTRAAYRTLVIGGWGYHGQHALNKSVPESHTLRKTWAPGLEDRQHLQELADHTVSKFAFGFHAHTAGIADARKTLAQDAAAFGRDASDMNAKLGDLQKAASDASTLASHIDEASEEPSFMPINLAMIKEGWGYRRANFVYQEKWSKAHEITGSFPRPTGWRDLLGLPLVLAGPRASIFHRGNFESFEEFGRCFEDFQRVLGNYSISLPNPYGIPRSMWDRDEMAAHVYRDLILNPEPGTINI